MTLTSDYIGVRQCSLGIRHRLGELRRAFRRPGGDLRRECKVRLEQRGAMPRTADDAAKTPAERMWNYRQRQRRQWRSVRIELAAVEIDALVKRGYLDPKEPRRSDRHWGSGDGIYFRCPIRNVTIDRPEVAASVISRAERYVSLKLSLSELRAPSAPRSPRRRWRKRTWPRSRARTENSRRPAARAKSAARTFL
jgi:hypothetical protein